MSHIPTEIDIAALVAALRNGEQADMDGCRVKVSRQACEEGADLIIAQDAELKRYRAALEFYADEKRTGLPSDGPWGVGSNDWGNVARAALGEKP